MFYTASTDQRASSLLPVRKAAACEWFPELCAISRVVIDNLSLEESRCSGGLLTLFTWHLPHLTFTTHGIYAVT
jgi:hypothetical protein